MLLGTLLLTSAAFAQPERVNSERLGRLPAFSHATTVGDLIFVSGTLGTEGAGLGLVDGGMAAQTLQTLRNIETILHAAGATLADVAKCNVYVTDMDRFQEMNEAYIGLFGDSPPARTTIESSRLALGALVEIECIAHRPRQREALSSSSFEGALDKLSLESGFVESEGEKIYYQTIGDGPVVVLSHGAGGNHTIWYQQVPALAAKYRVVTWDQRSFGRSTNHAGKAGPEAFARDLVALLDHLEIERAHLVGQSMGGWTVVRFALDHPQRVRSLVLADTVGGLVTDLARRDFARLASRGLDTSSLPIHRHPAIGQQLSTQDPAKAFLYRQIGDLGGEREPRIGERLFAADYSARASELTMPTLLIVGSGDDLFRPATIHSVAALLPSARVVEIPAAGHSPYFEAAGRWNRVVMDFLGAE